MEYNKDESFRCLEIAANALAKGDKERAIKFITKSKRLYPLEEADRLLDQVNNSCNDEQHTPSQNTNTSESNGIRNRSHDKSNSSDKAYTKEQVEAVNRIKRCKDYYEILGIAKDAGEAEIKKKYRKLALQFHPDKNQAPGATEAFKAIGNAFSILSDPEKRRKYDLYGPETNNSRHNRGTREWDYSHGFEAEMSPEEIFNMFFGFSNVSTRHSHNSTAHTFRRHHHRRNQETDWSQLLLQLSPILVLLVLSVVSLIFTAEDPYSFTQNSKYNTPRRTQNLKVLYYVKPDFTSNFYGTSFKKVEREIENVYIQRLQQECYGERLRKESLLWRARNQKDQNAYERAQNTPMKSCKRLEELHSPS